MKIVISKLTGKRYASSEEESGQNDHLIVVLLDFSFQYTSTHNLSFSFNFSFQWPIVTTTLAENRHELVLSGASATTLLSEMGFDERIYDLVKLNFLEISQSTLECLSEKIENLKCLTQLCLASNRLLSVPESLGRLQALKFLDISFNQLNELPDSVFQSLENLTVVNLSGNNLKYIPSVAKLQALQEFTASKNYLEVGS